MQKANQQQSFMNNRILVIVATGIFFILTWPAWQWLWREWMSNEYYSHGVLIPLVTIFLAVQRIRNDKNIDWQKPKETILANILSIVLIAASLLLFLYFLDDKAFYLASMAMILLVAGLVWTFGGNPIIRVLIFPIAYLFLMIPLPFIERSTLPLAMFTGVCSGGLVQFLGLDVTIVGNSVTLPNANLVIGAQCSGVNSLIALFALMLLVAYLFNGSLWSRVALVLLSIPIAVLGNILRVSSLLFIARLYGAEAAFIFYHDYSGPVFFILVLLLMWPLTRLLQLGNLRTEVI